MASAGPSRTGWTIREYRDSDFAAIRSCVAELQELERRLDARLRPGEALADDPSGAVAGFVAVLARVPFTELDDPPGAFALLSDLRG